MNSDICVNAFLKAKSCVYILFSVEVLLKSGFQQFLLYTCGTKHRVILKETKQNQNKTQKINTIKRVSYRFV